MQEELSPGDVCQGQGLVSISMVIVQPRGEVRMQLYPHTLLCQMPKASRGADTSGVMVTVCHGH